MLGAHAPALDLEQPGHDREREAQFPAAAADAKQLIMSCCRERDDDVRDSVARHEILEIVRERSHRDRGSHGVTLARVVVQEGDGTEAELGLLDQAPGHPAPDDPGPDDQRGPVAVSPRPGVRLQPQQRGSPSRQEHHRREPVTRCLGRDVRLVGEDDARDDGQRRREGGLGQDRPQDVERVRPQRRLVHSVEPEEQRHGRRESDRPHQRLVRDVAARRDGRRDDHDQPGRDRQHGDVGDEGTALITPRGAGRRRPPRGRRIGPIGLAERVRSRAGQQALRCCSPHERAGRITRRGRAHSAIPLGIYPASAERRASQPTLALSRTFETLRIEVGRRPLVANPT